MKRKEGFISHDDGLTHAEREMSDTRNTITGFCRTVERRTNVTRVPIFAARPGAPICRLCVIAIEREHNERTGARA